ncbi:sigma-54-dependent transcriptional regulator [Cobetia amphilecti]|uniref:sigma-54-dependent transcriptional regulator n=1 Tax=Cobetia amphilecti TaxID=1055104 RepID=UPI001FD5AC0C|nr:sigma-54 dependent transcriptional regulator [Cobetia amphilecti]
MSDVTNTDMQVLVVDDEPHLRDSLSQSLMLADYRTRPLASAEQALAILRAEAPFEGVVVTDIRMPGMDGLSLLHAAHAVDDELPVIVMTGHGDIDTAVAAMQAGAWDFIEKPFDRERMLDGVRRAVAARRLALENRSLREQLDTQRNSAGPRLVGSSDIMQRLDAQVSRLAAVDADTLLYGETGAGKDRVARCLHERSARASKPFVALNCGGMPETLIESELFGHEKGAFTGASERRIGKLEHADGGTLFLDEIESMPMSLQIKLLRVLQERSIERLGSNTPRPIDIRVIAATKRDLREAASAGEFREDLYYRLNVVTLYLPPLREHAEDILQLFRHFAILASERTSLEVPPLDATTLQALLAHDWPGNVRELRNCAERHVLLGGLEGNIGDSMAEGRPLTAGTSGPAVNSTEAAREADRDGITTGTGERHASGEPRESGELGELEHNVKAATQAQSLPQRMEAFEAALIREALAASKGQVVMACERLGLPRKTLYDKLKKHGLSAEPYRA